MLSNCTHLVSVHDITRDRFEAIFEAASRYQNGLKSTIKPFIAMLWFLEPSTRTRLSFDVAVKRLGGQAVNVPAIPSLKIAEGESLEDTLKVVSSYGDLLVLRTPEIKLMEMAARFSMMPVINAGDGTNEHPTQTILDLYSFWREFGRIDGLKIVLAADLPRARVAKSLVEALRLFKVDLTILTSQDFDLTQSMHESLEDSQITWRTSSNFAEAIRDADAIYMTRFHHPRVHDPEKKKHLRESYFRLTPEILAHAPSTCRVFHCMVRHEELSSEIDALPQAAYFRQAQNGVYARMAIIEHLLAEKL